MMKKLIMTLTILKMGIGEQPKPLVKTKNLNQESHILKEDLLSNFFFFFIMKFIKIIFLFKKIIQNTR